MVKHSTVDLTEYISSLNMNGLQGRMLNLPASSKSNKEILFVYGHHSTLSQWFPFIKSLSRYGNVTTPDLPGFGGMKSLYKIHEGASLENLADYLASFVKLRYKRRRLTIIGWSYGFVIVTKMLERYPDIAKKIDLVVSLGGFSHHDDFVKNPKDKLSYLLQRFFSHRFSSWFFRYIILSLPVWKITYGSNELIKKLYKNLAAETYQYDNTVELQLWRLNDIRTHMSTIKDLRKLDNCHNQLNIPLWHTPIFSGFNLDSHIVLQHLLIVYSDVSGTIYPENSRVKPNIMDENGNISFVIPSSLRKLLNENSW